MNLLHRYRKQSVVAVLRLIVVSSSAIVLASCGNGRSALVAEMQQGNSGRTFADWCRDRASLSPETKHTVEMLLKQAETTDCDAANQKLSSLTSLLLFDNEISDIKPLQSLTKLTWLSLRGNQISDIKPLQGMTNLTWLSLNNTQISDIKPLQSLTNLNRLYLFDNKISDIKPLQSLFKLIQLNLSGNQISNIKPLQSLTNLTHLNLSENPIAPKICPLKPESICQWESPTKP